MIENKWQSVMDILEAMRDWFNANRQEDVGLLTEGHRPHERFLSMHGMTALNEPVMEAFVDEMLTRQPHKRVSGAQAYRHLRTAVMQHYSVDAQQWPNYR